MTAKSMAAEASCRLPTETPSRRLSALSRAQTLAGSRAARGAHRTAKPQRVHVATHIRRSRLWLRDDPSSSFPQDAQAWESTRRGYRACGRRVHCRPVRDKALYRRKLAYPILTLVVAGIVYLSSRGHIGTAPPATPADYEAAAREVMAAVRAGKPIPNASGPLVESMFEMMAPEAVRSASGGELVFAVRGPVDASGQLPWMRSVEVRAPGGASVNLSISILNGRAEVAGVSRGSEGMPAQAEGAADR